MAENILIVGGVAGGASCAARLRRLNEQARIVLFERGEFISFANCGLPYYIGGTIKKRDDLLLQTPESFHNRFNVDVRVRHEVTAIDRQNKTVEVRDLASGDVYRESYDKLVLSPGSSPMRPPIPGIDNESVLSLWTIPDMDRISARLDEGVREAVVVGGGFIGIEMAENLVDRGLSVTLVEMLDQVMAPLDFDMAQMVHKQLADKGVRLILSDGVDSFEDSGDGVTIHLKSGRSVDAGLVILSIGVRPNGKLAADCGLEVNGKGGIVVDESLHTSDPDIYAIGDAVQVVNFVCGENAMIPLAGPANKMGRMAADNICGMDRTYKGTQGSTVAKVFDLTVAATGINEKNLSSLGRKLWEDYGVAIIHPRAHAGYYPGGMPLTLKLIYDREGRVLGAQSVGYEGVDKRIDVLASVIRFGGTVKDLEELELCYAPPYSSAKDPVNMAGFVAENQMSGTVPFITCKELQTLDRTDIEVLDVRTAPEIQMGAIPGSIDIPVDSLRERLTELPRDKGYVVYCAVGIRAYMACRILMQNGYENVRNLSGGYTSWRVVTGDYTDQEPAAPREAESAKPIEEAPLKVAATLEVDACGLQCPGPVMKLYEAMQKAEDGDVIMITATDPGFFSDAAAWCARTHNTYLKGEKQDKNFAVWIRKGCVGEDCNVPTAARPDGKSIIVFSGDLDKALASFIIANGAAAMGRQVTMFFTFWGLNVLRRHDRVKVKKGFLEKMFGMMMPRGTRKLKLSKLNMGGMGSGLMRHIMRKKNVLSLDELIDTAMKSGVRMVACTMSMDIMGITRDELIDGLDYAGVASYLGAAESCDTNLFI